jgi:large subunit ribosomal protein L15
MAGILNELGPPHGSVRKRKRVGRGHASGTGKTSGRGHKGTGARAGGKIKAGFEGGQMPLQRRLPKRGFTNIFRREYQIVNVGALDSFESGSILDATSLAQSGLVRSPDLPVKVLGQGEIKSAVTIKANAFSASARTKIESAGGKAETL